VIFYHADQKKRAAAEFASPVCLLRQQGEAAETGSRGHLRRCPIGRGIENRVIFNEIARFFRRCPPSQGEGGPKYEERRTKYEDEKKPQPTSRFTAASGYNRIWIVCSLVCNALSTLGIPRLRTACAVKAYLRRAKSRRNAVGIQCRGWHNPSGLSSIRMSGNLMAANVQQPLEIVFGVPGGDLIRFDVLGQTCPDANEDWYSSQLDVAVHICVGMVHSYRSLVMFSDDFHCFRSELRKLSSGETTFAVLETSDFLFVTVRFDGSSYDVSMQLDALEQDGELVLREGGTENWEWHLAIERNALDGLIDGVIRVSNRYRTWSVPKS
jgi:hypothetical protein